jgi:hypothetical protein
MRQASNPVHRSGRERAGATHGGAEEGAVASNSGGTEILIEERLELVVRRHLMSLATLFVEPDPAVLGEMFLGPAGPRRRRLVNVCENAIEAQKKRSAHSNRRGRGRLALADFTRPRRCRRRSCGRQPPIDKRGAKPCYPGIAIHPSEPTTGVQDANANSAPKHRCHRHGDTSEASARSAPADGSWLNRCQTDQRSCSCLCLLHSGDPLSDVLTLCGETKKEPSQ